MTLHPVFRAVCLFVLMGALLLLYGIHPIAGWATLTMLAIGTVVVRCRRPHKLIAD